jgi:uncharacterized protein YuzB (UPF0349 family)
MIIVYCDSCHEPISEDNDVHVTIVCTSRSLQARDSLHLCMKCWGKTVAFLSGNIVDGETRFDEIHKLLEQERDAAESPITS